MISGHNNYWLWGYGEYQGELLILVTSYPREALQQEFCVTLELAETIQSPYAMPYENNLPIYLCKGQKMPMATFWSKVKHYE